ncbi:MAG: hypothetical protein COU46_02885 [Candidatus Niyogibacteria bacterium CG10_big_fil_rev_8_21_14_0_10_42_19]|uniref:Uncharacterized protein n=1 Tax=Candidatus Niyogibacteria bacterium CG10_big_fil_rev_8_21_14_0_10_42_19 TaxID=1974725 RepID=A0A2H0TF48_9BACT|nr:MAG: hypothetical protein COU46_02885 [Candidatus Niyogibacteria bacterium CG10_big_fil_rev_8_21_14_0_10_42_19]
MKKTASHNLKNKKGFGLIEIVLALGIISLAFFTLIRTAQIAFKIIGESSVNSRAQFLITEGFEVVRSLRDESWQKNINTVVQGTIYYPSFSTSTNKWALITENPGLIDDRFERIITFEDVYRKKSDLNIVASTSPDEKSIDPGTKKITVTATWFSNRQTNTVKSASTYLTNLFEN